VTFDDEMRSCGFADVAEGVAVPTRAVTNPPTISTDPPTIHPTNKITPSPTTKRPTIRPTTLSPSKKPTVAPTIRNTTSPPSKNPTTSPPSKNPTIPPTNKVPLTIATREPTTNLDFHTCDYNGICSADEHDESCSADCTGIVLNTHLENGGSDDYIEAKGTMFSLQSNRNIIITSIDMYSTEVSVDRVEIYTKPGGYIGYESRSGAWTRVYNNHNNLKGLEPTTLNLNNGEGVSVPANTEASFFIFTESLVRCEEGTGLGDLLVNDSVLDVYQGMELNDKWGGENRENGRPLAFRGAFKYDVVKTAPTTAPTIASTTAPTRTATTTAPTVVQEVGSGPRTSSPTKVMTRPTPLPTTPPATIVSTSLPKSAAPTVVGDGSGDTTSPTSPTVVYPATGTTIMREYKVSFKMILYHSDLLNANSEKIWIDVTMKTIHNEAVAMTGIDSESVEVEVELVDQVLEPVRMLSRTHHVDALSQQHKSLRNLQKQALPLQIDFTTTIQFPSEDDDWDANKMVTSAFQSPSQQRDYIIALQEAEEDGTTYFERLESMSMIGDLITEGETPSASPDGAVGGIVGGAQEGDANGIVGGGDSDNNGNGKNTMYFIIAGVVAAACILLFAMSIAIYYITRKNRHTENTKTSNTATTTKQDNAHPPQHPNNKVGMYDMDKLGGLEIETKSDHMLHHQPTPTSYVGEDGEMDDVSTLGDPYMGDAVNAVMDRDNNTVGESMVSSQQELYVYGVGRPTGGTTVGGGSTIHDGSKIMIFGDDPTLEDIYRSPQSSNMGGDHHYNGGSNNFDRITVVAPAGKLGIVLDNPHGDLPIVWAIKETSALNGRARVGDLLLSVDGVDCRGMNTHRVSTFLSGRSMNPSRTLVLARGSKMVGV